MLIRKRFGVHSRMAVARLAAVLSLCVAAGAQGPAPETAPPMFPGRCFPTAPISHHVKQVLWRAYRLRRGPRSLMKEISILRGVLSGL